MAVAAQTKAIRHSRFWEVDLFRTIAVAMMITFHTLYLLNFFDIRNTGVPAPPYGFWWWFPRMTGGIFIFTAGISLPIAYSKVKRTWPFMRRGLEIFAWGMGITLVTWLISRQGYVRFGILHFFGTAFILAPFFLRFRFINLVLGTALMAAGIWLQVQRVYFDFSGLLWLGLIPRGLSTWDYWPLLPWFGLFLLGMFCSTMLYPQGNRRFGIHEFTDPVTSALILPGRHPLVVYLAQWPAIIGILLLVFPGSVLPYFPPLPF